uniref:Uncharacterized protein n=1 Tax=Cannabis sativa TaxID=3483 RepID=A0A803P5F3_CANSA
MALLSSITTIPTSALLDNVGRQEIDTTDCKTVYQPETFVQEIYDGELFVKLKKGVDLLAMDPLVENHIVGAPCGVMDQMTSTCGKANKFLAMVCQVPIGSYFCPLIVYATRPEVVGRSQPFYSKIEE